LATVGISLVREHTEAIKPPRALWVPFPLGRPLGEPNDEAFQLDVLRAVLALCEAPQGPVLEDYPHDSPSMAPPEDLWACPVSFPSPEATTEGEALRQQVAQEIRMLGPWYEEGRKQRGRTTVGISGKGPESIEEMAAIIATYGAGEEIDIPQGFAFEWPRLLRYLTDDIRAYYFEAAVSQPGSAAPSPDELNEWLYRQTTFGELLYRCRDRMRESDDTSVPMNRRASFPIVPRAMRERRPATTSAK
jgi:hypothetical protein